MATSRVSTPVELDPVSRLGNGVDVYPQAPSGRDAARTAARERIRELGYASIRSFAISAGLPYNNVAQFLSGQRDWPRRESRASLELALGWEPGELARIALASGTVVEGKDLGRSVESATHSGDISPPVPNVLLDFPPGVFEGLTRAEADEVKAVSLAAGLRRLREIRAARASGDRDGDERHDGDQG